MKTILSKTCAGVALALAAAAPAYAFDLCDFEDGTLCGWLTSTTGGGSGSTSVVEHNGSMQAQVQHTGRFSHALSKDFAYVASDWLSFDMHAITNSNSFNTTSASGVRISFLDAFNAPLGTTGLFNVSGAGWLEPNESEIDIFPHSYAQPLLAWADRAGLSPASPIATFTVSFLATAQTVGNSAGVFNSNAVVWFDNVTVGAVPEPLTSAMLLAGLAGIALVSHRRRARGGD